MYSASRLLPHTERPVNFFVKAGGMVTYFTFIIFVPDLGIEMTALVAGVPKTAEWLREEITTAIVPAIEQIGIESLRQYAGTYRASSIDTELTLAVSLEHGLFVSAFKSNGTDMLATLDNIAKQSELHTPKAFHYIMTPALVGAETAKERWRLEQTTERHPEDKKLW